jgi:hypothetical protein
MKVEAAEFRGTSRRELPNNSIEPKRRAALGSIEKSE